ncbi:hypothetical protein Rsub_12064 [Raphidocelis subcapitata]|uniref:Uncharacterized protein n=1 Tax=Raphidocelis subcapitata TaxID=307507 RepID=A0A2V0PNR4_9CHLO|nr:hypothetical protein Rsub_12064 [Raphidocelis subcapitata]|eukprot:GBF99600.1 hypothetical protein Rsub_12064 [Raphidocelis subcapitata]
MLKRKRAAGDLLDEAVEALEQASGHGGPETKIQALQALVALVDPVDETYEVQRRALDAGAVEVVRQLLEEPSEGGAAAAAAAAALAALTRHASRVEAARLALNPVQEVVGGDDGVISILVGMRFGGGDAPAAAATEALSALTSHSRSNTLALMREVVHRLACGEARALSALDDLAAGLDARDDVAVVTDQALMPALGFLREGEPRDRAAAARLLAGIADARPGPAAFLLAEGALPHAAALLRQGDLEARDAAAHLAWVLVRGERRVLAPSRGALGCEGAALVGPLLELVEAAEQAERQRDAAEGAPSGSGDDGGGDGEGERGGEPAPAVDNGDAALLLLRALTAADPDAAARLRGAGSGWAGEGDARGGGGAGRSCAVM